MPKRITIAPHLPLEELESRYRKATDPVQRSHYQILWLLASGKKSDQVSCYAFKLGGDRSEFLTVRDTASQSK